MTSDRYLSLVEVADYLGIKKDTLYRCAAKGKVPAHKVGRLWKFKRSEIDEWVQSGKAAQLR